MRSDYNQIPVVTVLMSVYNGEKYLRQAIDSILNQTLRDFEFVIYDDCSNDSTAEIINSYSDTRIVYRRNSSNKGLTANLADGVKRSAARYIARMDADDVAYSNRLKKAGGMDGCASRNHDTWHAGKIFFRISGRWCSL